MSNNLSFMKTERRNKERYRKPNDIDTYVLDIFLNRIYLDQDHLNRKSNMFLVPIFNPKTGEQFKLPREWSNTPRAIFEQYGREYGNKPGFDKPSIDKVYRALNKYVEAKIIIPASHTDKVNPESKYYPNETKEGFLALFNYVREDYFEGFYPEKKFNINPLFSEYTNRVLNRQFVLDILREKVDFIKIWSAGELIDLPLLGRYRKNYELEPELNAWIDKIGEVQEIISDEAVTSYRPVKNALLGIDEDMPNDRYHTITPEKRKYNLELLEKLKKGLISEREYLRDYVKNNADRVNNLDTISQFSDGTADAYAEHFEDISPDYHGAFDNSPQLLGLNWYKDEAVWTRPYLSPEETDRILKLNVDPTEYTGWLDEYIVMPILCLIQMSPAALYTFIDSDVWAPKNRIFTFTSERKRTTLPELLEPSDNPEMTKFLVNPKTFNLFLGFLTRRALADYIYGNVCIVKDNNFHGQLNRTQLITVGLSYVKLPDKKELHIPALFTFRIWKDYTLSILFSEISRHNPINDFWSPVADEPIPGQYDWSPALGISYNKVDYPSARLYELRTLIVHTITEHDFCLSHLLEQAFLKGTISPNN